MVFVLIPHLEDGVKRSDLAFWTIQVFYDRGRVMKFIPVRSILLCACLVLIQPARAAVVMPDELAESARWAAARFQGGAPSQVTTPALVVLANHDQVEKNGRQGKPLRIADREFVRGLFGHAPSRIAVRLPGPGGRFTATVGIDSNENTRPGRGSVDASVSVAGGEKFRSGVLREGMSGQPVSVDLAGATEFVLQAEETADGIACDQIDWADAKVTLQDGREL
jgi:hypothetical protein